MARLRTEDRFVTVKGLAERYECRPGGVAAEAPVAGNDLAQVQAQLDANAAKIRQFLLNAGFDAGEIAPSSPWVNDQEAYSYGDNQPKNRFRADSTVTVRSTKVEAAIKAMQRAGRTGQQRRPADLRLWPGRKRQLREYTALNDIKPALIAEARPTRARPLNSSRRILGQGGRHPPRQPGPDRHQRDPRPELAASEEGTR